MAGHPMQGRTSGAGGGDGDGKRPPAGGAAAAAEEAPDQRSEREERAGVAALARKFPAGLSAIEDLGDDDMVEVINVSLKPYTYTEYTGKKKQHRSECIIPPLGTATVKASRARGWMRPVKRPHHIYVVPKKGDCRNQIAFEAFGQQWGTCPFVDCPRHPEPRPGVRWSVWMIQHLVSSRETEPAMRRIVEEFDPRPDVLRWAFKLIAVREERRLQRMALVGTGDVSGRERRRARAVH